MGTENQVAIDITANDLADAALNKVISKINQVASETEKANARTKRSQENLSRSQDRQLAATRALRKAQFDMLKPEERMVALKERALRLEQMLGRERMTQARRYSLMAMKAQNDMALMDATRYRGAKPPVLGKPASGGGNAGDLAMSIMSYLGLGGITGFAGHLGKFGLPLGGLLAGATGAYKFGKGAIQSALSDQRTAQGEGLTLDELAGIKRASTKHDVDPGTLFKSFHLVQKAIGEALAGNKAFIDSFNTLGVTIRDLTSKDSFRIFLDLLRMMKTGSENPIKMAAGMSVLGRGMQEMLPAVRRGMGEDIAAGRSRVSNAVNGNLADTGEAVKGWMAKLWGTTKAGAKRLTSGALNSGRETLGAFLTPFAALSPGIANFRDSILPNYGAGHENDDLEIALRRKLAINQQKKTAKSILERQKKEARLTGDAEFYANEFGNGSGIRNDSNASAGLYTSAGSAAYAKSGIQIQMMNLRELQRVNDQLRDVKDSLEKTFNELTGE